MRACRLRDVAVLVFALQQPAGPAEWLLPCHALLGMNTCAATLLLPEPVQADLLTAQQIEDAEGHTVAVTGLCNVQANKAVLEAMQVWMHCLETGGRPHAASVGPSLPARFNKSRCMM